MPGELETIESSAMEAHLSGRFDEAETLCRAALLKDPEYFGSLVHLSVLRRNAGSFPESIQYAERAIKVRPDHVEGHTQMALALLGAGRPAEAIPILQRAIRLKPTLAPLYYNFGLALETTGRTQEAEQAFWEATKLSPRDVTARISLGSLMLRREDIRSAKIQALTAINLAPNSAAAYQLQAKTLVAENRGSEAENAIRRSLELDPASSFGHIMLGFRFLQTGKFEDAETEFKKSITIDPAQGTSYFGITQARKIEQRDRPLIAEMESVIAHVPLNMEEAGYLHFALAKSFDNLGEFGKAMGHYDEAHRNSQLYRFGETKFDAAAMFAEVEATKRIYSLDLMQDSRQGLDTDLPILIVGMMRSGTTLTEQILSCHPRVGAAGEQWFWGQRKHLAENLQSQKVDRIQAVALARQYCRELRKTAPGFSKVIDKLPGNYARLGLIHLAMPRAKFIHCRRHPIDTSLSIYFTPNPVAPLFTQTKEGIADVYQGYLELMEHWRQVLPAECLHEIQYEELVAEPERVIRGMLKFLGLDWSDECLSHEKNVKEVKTPSLWQVRQPMYSTSVARWRNYEPWLGGLKKLKEILPAR
jgi:tetratricopeptide (TPR) repeat protein